MKRPGVAFGVLASAVLASFLPLSGAQGGLVADFTWTPLEPTTETMVQFADASTATNGTIVAWSWTFGDGSSSTAQNPQHRFVTEGFYAVRLSARDDRDRVANVTKDVRVTSPVPTTTSPSGLAPPDAVSGAGPTSGGFQWPPPIIWIPSVIAVSVVLAFSFAYRASDRFRWRWWLLLGPLFSRFAKSEILENGMRETIYGYVEANPGAHLRGIQRDLKLRNGTLLHHLQMLEQHGFLKSARDGMYRRYFVMGAAPRFQGNEEMAQRVLKAVKATPGITAAQIAHSMGTRRSLIHYHVHRLIESGNLRKEGSGREVFLFPLVAGATSPAPVWSGLRPRQDEPAS